MGAPRQLITPLLWTSVSYLISTATADTGCFNPNGTDRNLGALDVPSGTNVYAPCNTVQPYSMCCRNSDKCLPNGLCQQAGSDIIWRESCSDQSWRSSACVKLCVSDTGMRSPLPQLNAPTTHYENPSSPHTLHRFQTAPPLLNPPH